MKDALFDTKTSYETHWQKMTEKVEYWQSHQCGIYVLYDTIQDEKMKDQSMPVSVAANVGQSPNTARIGMVYTPDKLRGKGYAKRVMIDTCKYMFEEDISCVSGSCASSLTKYCKNEEVDDKSNKTRPFLVLFTDLANSLSNKLYQSIGFKQVIDFDFVTFNY